MCVPKNNGFERQKVEEEWRTDLAEDNSPPVTTQTRPGPEQPHLPPHNTHFAANENVIAWKPAEERAEDIEKALEALNDAFPGAGTSTDDQTGAVRRPTQTSESTGVDS